MSVAKETVLELTVPTVFQNLNQAEGKEANFERTSLTIKRLKLKHILKMQTLPEDTQMFEAISLLTGLDSEDISELDAVDAAQLTSLVYESMTEFFKLADKINTATKGIE